MKLNQKKQIVKQLEKDLKEAESIAFINFSGLGAKEVNELRGALLESEAQLQVAKNNLIERAIHSLGFNDFCFGDIFTGPTALIFSFQDSLSGIKIADKFREQFKELEFKGGIFEDELVDSKGMCELAEIPGREELLAQFIITARAPLQRTVNSVNAPMRRFVSGLRTLSED